MESLKLIFEEEVHKDDEQFASNHPQNVNTIGDIVNKLGKDVKTVNKSLNAKYDKQKFVDNDINHSDLFFIDGSVTP